MCVFARSFCVCTRYLHPEGLPSDYTISMMLRLLPETPQEPFALWEILDKDNEPLVGLILDSKFESLALCFLSFSLSHVIVTQHSSTKMILEGFGNIRNDRDFIPISQ